MGNYSPKNISAEVAHLITKLLKQNVEACINTENVFEAVKRLEGKQRKFCQHVASDNSQYDVLGLKVISAKDIKSLYIILNQLFSSQSDLASSQYK